MHRMEYIKIHFSPNALAYHCLQTKKSPHARPTKIISFGGVSVDSHSWLFHSFISKPFEIFLDFQFFFHLKAKHQSRLGFDLSGNERVQSVFKSDQKPQIDAFEVKMNTFFL